MELGTRAIGDVLLTMAERLGEAFLAPGSSTSIGALACSFAVLVVLGIPAGRKRRVRLAAVRRALLPDRLWRSASGRADFAFFALGTLFFALLFGWMLFSSEQVAAAVSAFLPGPAAPRLPGWLGAAIATVAFFLAYEFAYWLNHWTMHKVPFLWRLHKVHHQAESLSLLTNFRVHPLEAVLFINMQSVIFGTTGALLDQALGARVDAWTLGDTNAIAFAFAVALTNLQHSHLWIGFGPRWGRLLLGPAHHQIHHSSDPAHFDKNLGSSLTLFDRLFGTFHLPAAARERLRFGVDDGETAPHGIRAALFAPFLPERQEPVDQRHVPSLGQ